MAYTELASRLANVGGDPSQRRQPYKTAQAQATDNNQPKTPMQPQNITGVPTRATQPSAQSSAGGAPVASSDYTVAEGGYANKSVNDALLPPGMPSSYPSSGQGVAQTYQAYPQQAASSYQAGYRVELPTSTTSNTINTNDSRYANPTATSQPSSYREATNTSNSRNQVYQDANGNLTNVYGWNIDPDDPGTGPAGSELPTTYDELLNLFGGTTTTEGKIELVQALLNQEQRDLAQEDVAQAQEWIAGMQGYGQDDPLYTEARDIIQQNYTDEISPTSYGQLGQDVESALASNLQNGVTTGVTNPLQSSVLSGLNQSYSLNPYSSDLNTAVNNQTLENLQNPTQVSQYQSQLGSALENSLNSMLASTTDYTGGNTALDQQVLSSVTDSLNNPYSVSQYDNELAQQLENTLAQQLQTPATISGYDSALNQQLVDSVSNSLSNPEKISDEDFEYMLVDANESGASATRDAMAQAQEDLARRGIKGGLETSEMARVQQEGQQATDAALRDLYIQRATENADALSEAQDTAMSLRNTLSDEDLNTQLAQQQANLDTQAQGLELSSQLRSDDLERQLANIEGQQYAQSAATDLASANRSATLEEALAGDQTTLSNLGLAADQYNSNQSYDLQRQLSNAGLSSDALTTALGQNQYSSDYDMNRQLQQAGLNLSAQNQGVSNALSLENMLQSNARSDVGMAGDYASQMFGDQLSAATANQNAQNQALQYGLALNNQDYTNQSNLVNALANLQLQMPREATNISDANEVFSTLRRITPTASTSSSSTNNWLSGISQLGGLATQLAGLFI